MTGVLQMTEEKGTIFNIQKFSITDGVGIRTLVFMKGCPLRCLWCSNPESQERRTEIMFVRTNCIGCGNCVGDCELHAVDPQTYDIDRTVCIRCGACTEHCYANAKKKVGRDYTVGELMDIISRDRIFYQNSGGGVTVGGGEPLMQPAFAAEFLEACQSVHIHTAIETCGYGEWERIRPVFLRTDQIFFDLKLMDSRRHREVTGVGNELILENAAKMSALGRETIFRIPLIRGVNDTEENLDMTAAFVTDRMKDNENISVELLPYHSFGRDKYRWLDREYAMKEDAGSSEERMEERKRFLRNRGLNVL